MVQEIYPIVLNCRAHDFIFFYFDFRNKRRPLTNAVAFKMLMLNCILFVRKRKVNEAILHHSKKFENAFMSSRLSIVRTVGSTEAPSKVFLLFSLFSDWLKSNHLRSRIECGFFDIFRTIFVAL